MLYSIIQYTLIKGVVNEKGKPFDLESLSIFDTSLMIDFMSNCPRQTLSACVYSIGERASCEFHG